MNCGFEEKTHEPGLRFNVYKINLLANMKNDFFNELILKLPTENITEEFISEFLKVLKSSKGKITLSLSLEDKKNKSEVTVFSRNHQIKLSDKLIEYLENNKYFNYIKLNWVYLFLLK